MSATVQQIYIANPSTTIANGDLIYLVQSPYTPGTDSAIIGSNLKAMFLQPSNNLSDLSNIASARSNLGLTAIASATPPLSATLGGTGINNGASTITIGGSFSMVGAFTFAGTLTGNTSVTFPTSGTLATTSQLPTFPITLAQGGTNASLTASNGGIFYSTATAGAILAGTATARQMLQSGATAAPTWSTATWPATTTANAVLFSSATNTVSEIISAASSVLITSAGSVPSFSQTLPSAVQTNITALGAQSQALNMNTHQINNLSAGVAATDAANVGQVTAASSPLTTKGDLYTFTTVNARLPVGTTNGQVLQVNSAAATGLSYSTPTYPSASGTAGFIVRSDGTNNVYSQSTFADLYAASSVLYANGANNVAGLATANNGLLVTSNTGVPSILAGPGTTGNILQSNAAAAPSFSTSTYPSTNAINTLLYASSANVMSALATVNNAFLTTAAGGVPTWNTNLPINKVSIQVFVASGTYTPTPGMIFCVTEAVGQGGGGGGAASSTGGGSGGGGGSGSYSRKVSTAATIGASQTVTIANTGGTGGTAGNNAGTAGSDASLGVICVGKGGTGGGGAAANGAGTGGAGGIAGTGDVTAVGNAGRAGNGGTLVTISYVCGHGAPSFFGGSPATKVGNTTATGASATNYGAGGDGGLSFGAGGAAAGGNGSGGIIIVTEFCSI